MLRNLEVGQRILYIYGINSYHGEIEKIDAADKYRVYVRWDEVGLSSYPVDSDIILNSEIIGPILLRDNPNIKFKEVCREKTL